MGYEMSGGNKIEVLDFVISILIKHEIRLKELIDELDIVVFAGEDKKREAGEDFIKRYGKEWKNRETNQYL